MSVDIPTMMIAGAFTTGLAGLLIAFAWVSDRSALALPWMSTGYLLSATGILTLLSLGPSDRSVGGILGGIFLILGPAFAWTAFRVFNSRAPLPAVIVGAVALTLVMTAFPPFDADARLVFSLNLGVIAAFLFVAAIELERQPRIQLRARMPLFAFVLIHATVFTVGAIESASHLIPMSAVVPFTLWFGLIHFEQIIFAVASAIFMVAMIREASEHRHEIAARVDTLTGLTSRGAFLEQADKQLLRCLTDDAPFSLVMFDLDRFKDINDTYGHAAGDEVLHLFGKVARERLRPGDLIGRLGGEEFAAAMPGVSPGAAYVVAERIRFAFADAGLSFSGRHIAATVSAGVATAHPRSSLEQLIKAADAALYRAKARGRNRVEMTVPGERDEAADVVVRVA